MFVEIPEFRRCCFCLPLRRGILVFGYLSLLVTCVFMGLQAVMWMIYNQAPVDTVTLYRGVVLETQMTVVFLLYILDIVFNIVLIIGAHMKRRRLMRIYYYYQLTTIIASFIVVIITQHSLMDQLSRRAIIISMCLSFTGFVLQIYLLLLIRSELRKERYSEGSSSYVNHIAEVFIDPPLRRQWRTAL